MCVSICLSLGEAQGACNYTHLLLLPSTYFLTAQLALVSNFGVQGIAFLFVSDQYRLVLLVQLVA